MTFPTLVTGGAGFLGSHICQRLLTENVEVLCLDNFSTGRKSNNEHLLDNTFFEVMRHNIWEPIYPEVSQIFNFACPASPKYYQVDGVATIKTAVLGAINMLGLAKRTNAKIFQASTSEIYGEPHEHPQKESYWGNVNPIGIRACYDEGKRCAETIFFDYHRQYNIDIRVGRLFNTYGPRMQLDDGRVVSNFILQALQNRPISIYGSGNQTRSFCYVDDLIDGIFKFMDQSSEENLVNIGNTQEVTILELAERICEYCESSSDIKFYELPSDDPSRRQPDIHRLMSITDWRPKVSLEDGLKETINYFKGKLQI